MMHAPPIGTEFGALPRSTVYGDGTFPKWTDWFELIARRLWVPTSMNRHVKTIYSQLDGMCTSNGACETMMTERSIRGRPHVELSPEHLFGQHSKWGQGSTLDENLKAMVDVGVCTRAKVPQDAWRPSDWPDDAEADAAQNRMLEWLDLNADFDAVATAIQQHRPCLIGVRWPGSRGGGHAVCATQLDRDDRGWLIRGPNSWSEDWGESPGYTKADFEWLHIRNLPGVVGGFYTLTEDQCRDFSSFGCWAAGSSTDGVPQIKEAVPAVST